MDVMSKQNKYAEEPSAKNVCGVGGGLCGQNKTMNQCGEYLPSLREQAEKSANYHMSEAKKADQAAAFFGENPAFEEFILLVRSGAIQL